MDRILFVAFALLAIFTLTRAQDAEVLKWKHKDRYHTEKDYGNPNNEKTFKFNLKGEGVTQIGDQEQIGGRMIFDCEVECHGHQCPPGETRVYERYGHCVTVNVDTTKGIWMLCTVETYFSAGSVIMEGTYYFKDGIFTGTTAITGGTGMYVGAEGEETIKMDSTKEPATGTAVMRVSI